jgi:hypothetical protein
MSKSKAVDTLGLGDELQRLLDSCHRNNRPAKFKLAEQKIFFDADRFRWWFNYGCHNADLLGACPLGAEGKSIKAIREWMDTEMLKHPEQLR